MPLIFELKVVPSSGRSGFIKDKSGMIKCYLKSPPEDGKANRELLKLVAKTVDVPQDHISIIQGLTSRKKKIKINKQITIEELYQSLGLEQEVQQKIC